MGSIGLSCPTCVFSSEWRNRQSFSLVDDYDHDGRAGGGFAGCLRHGGLGRWHESSDQWLSGLSTLGACCPDLETYDCEPADDPPHGGHDGCPDGFEYPVDSRVAPATFVETIHVAVQAVAVECCRQFVGALVGVGCPAVQSAPAGKGALSCSFTAFCLVLRVVFVSAVRCLVFA